MQAPRTFLSSLPVGIVIDPRLSTPRWLGPLVNIAAVIVALLLGMVVLAIVGGNPFATYSHIAQSAFGDRYVFSDTLVKATPLILVGLGCSLAFRMKLWNIGAEGQLYIGALCASACVLTGLITAATPQLIALAVMLAAGMAGGAIWGLVPGLLKAKLGINEIIITLMMNYIALALVNFFVFAVWSEGGFAQSKTFPRNAWLPRASEYDDMP